MKKNENVKRFSRRDFLKTSATTAAATGGLSVASGLIFTDAIAATGNHYDKTLFRIARDIYPHEMLEDKFYAQPLVAIKETDADLLKQGVNDLDAIAIERIGKKFVDIPEEPDRVRLLRSIEETPFFSKMKLTMMMGIYNNPEVWPFFGYEGSSWEKGGYLNRGFNDLKWL
jgi:hypothetical protein